MLSGALLAGVKSLIAGEQQAAVTVAVEGLMEARPVPELESFATFDPRVINPLPIPSMLILPPSCQYPPHARFHGC